MQHGFKSMVGSVTGIRSAKVGSDIINSSDDSFSNYYSVIKGEEAKYR